MEKWLALLLLCFPPISVRSAVILIGGTGDLAGRYLWDAIFHEVFLQTEEETFIAAGSSPIDQGQTKLSKILLESAYCSDAECERKAEGFRASIEYFQLRNGADYRELCLRPTIAVSRLNLVYLAMWPGHAQNSLEWILEHCGGRNMRILVEKPFAESRQHAEHIITLTESLEQEGHAVLFVDHYLSKAAVLSMQKLYDDDDVFQKEEILDIELAILERNGVSPGRLENYDSCGVFMDVLHNHLTLLLTRLHPRWESLRSLRWTGALLAAQHRDYSRELPSSATPTFGAVEFELDGATRVVLKSWKYLSERISYFSMSTPDHRLILVISPRPSLLFPRSLPLDIPVTEPEPDLAAFFKLHDYVQAEISEKKSAYRSVIAQAVRLGKVSRSFLSKEEVLGIWELWEPIIEAVSERKLHLYESSRDLEGLLLGRPTKDEL